MLPDSDQSLELLYQAAAAPLGIVISVGDFKACQQRLYTARRESGDPALAALEFRQSPHGDGTLWIVKPAAKVSPPDIGPTP